MCAIGRRTRWCAQICRSSKTASVAAQKPDFAQKIFVKKITLQFTCSPTISLPAPRNSHFPHSNSTCTDTQPLPSPRLAHTQLLEKTFFAHFEQTRAATRTYDHSKCAQSDGEPDGVLRFAVARKLRPWQRKNQILRKKSS